MLLFLEHWPLNRDEVDQHPLFYFFYFYIPYSSRVTPERKDFDKPLAIIPSLPIPHPLIVPSLPMSKWAVRRQGQPEHGQWPAEPGLAWCPHPSAEPMLPSSWAPPSPALQVLAAHGSHLRAPLKARFWPRRCWEVTATLKPLAFSGNHLCVTIYAPELPMGSGWGWTSFFLIFIYSFICFWLCWVFVATWAFL